MALVCKIAVSYKILLPDFLVLGVWMCVGDDVNYILWRIEQTIFTFMWRAE